MTESVAILTGNVDTIHSDVDILLNRIAFL